MMTEKTRSELRAIYGGILLFFCVFINVWGFSMIQNPIFIEKEIVPSFIPVTLSGIQTSGYVVVGLGIVVGLMGCRLVALGLLRMRQLDAK